MSSLGQAGTAIDFYLSSTRNTAAAKRLLAKALRGLKDWEQPSVINTDKAASYGAAIAERLDDRRVPGENEGFKQVIGDGLRSRTDERRATEVDIAVHALNRISELGRPNYVRTA